MGNPLNERQQAVLEWIAAGCRAGEQPAERHKVSAVALARQNLILLDNRWGTPWRAKLTPLGRYWLEHREYPPAGAVLEPLLDADEPEGEAAGRTLSDAEFVNRRRVLKSDWIARGRAMSELNLPDQWALHTALQPSTETLADANALNDYRNLARHDPERVSEAALAWERYQHAHELMLQQAALTGPGQDTDAVPTRRKRKDRPLSVRAVARPEPDLGRLAQLLVQLATQAAKERADDPDMPAEERQRSQTSSALLSRLEHHRPAPVRPPREERKHRVGSPSQPALRTMPTAITAKLTEASVCHDAGSHLAAVLVARSAVVDVLHDFGEPASSDDLASALTRLADRRHLSQQTAALAGSQRCLAMVPTHTPVTAVEVQTLMNAVGLLVAELYKATPTEEGALECRIVDQK